MRHKHLACSVTEFEPWQGARSSCVLQYVQTRCGTSQPPVQVVLGALSPGVKFTGDDANRLPPCSAEVENV